MRSSSSSSSAYGETWYWDNRYSKESSSGTTFEWYHNYSSLSPLIHLYIPSLSSSSPSILVVGCGNSGFSEGLVSDGYENVVNIDISSVVIEAMQNKYSHHHPRLKYLNMDVRDMTAFQPSSFDAVVDKGTLDSILCGNNARENATIMLDQVWRVLKDKGVYILITYGAPVYRLRLLRESCSWTIKLHVIDKLIIEETSDNPSWPLTNPLPLDDGGSSVESVLGKNPDVHYIYVCTKDESLKPNSMDQMEAN